MSSSLELKDLADQVTDELSLVKFMQALGADFADERVKEEASRSSPYGPGANGWENPPLDEFFEAACAWAEDSRDALPLEVAQNPWRRCAHILLMGKLYE